MACRYDAPMALPAQKLDRRLTVEEYLRFEETSQVRHEYHDGEVLAMSGGTFEHAAVTTNLVATLHAALRNGPCRVLDSNMRVAVSKSRQFVYPDASILCQPPQFHFSDPKRTTIINPRVILEVLSESTESYDRGEKFEKYRLIESLEEYVLLAQDRPAVDGYLRQPDGSWNLIAWQEMDSEAQVRCMKLSLPLSELYAGVAFAERRTRRRKMADQ